MKRTPARSQPVVACRVTDGEKNTIRLISARLGFRSQSAFASAVLRRLIAMKTSRIKDFLDE